MEYKTRIEKRARKQILKLPRNYQIKVYNTIVDLGGNPFQGKKLEGELKGQYSIRVWPYRIIYQIYKKELIISIIDVGHRQGVYK
ncbi:type II toxin-antitoxin system RelE/ParE family toxin [Candidatus Nomurabacteria bacterium]|nr:type II toxin-antitoxin system RelE/ParE family toxin [Candidatus Nomurabacteria bacterium]